MMENAEALVEQLAEKYAIKGYLDEGKIRIQVAKSESEKEALELVGNLYEEAERKRESAYQNRLKNFENAETIQDFQNVKESFDVLEDYKDAKVFSQKCQEKLDELKAQKAQARKEEEAVLEEQLQDVYKQDKKEVKWMIVGIVIFIIAFTVVMLAVGQKIMLW